MSELDHERIKELARHIDEVFNGEQWSFGILVLVAVTAGIIAKHVPHENWDKMQTLFAQRLTECLAAFNKMEDAP